MNQETLGQAFLWSTGTSLLTFLFIGFDASYVVFLSSLIAAGIAEGGSE